MKMFKSIGTFAVASLVAASGFAQVHRPAPGPRPGGPGPTHRPAPGPRPGGPGPGPTHRPAPAPRPMPHPAPHPAPMPRPAPRPMPRPAPRPMPRPAPRPMPRPLPRPSLTQACFYEHINYGGRRVCLNHGQTIMNLNDYGMNDTITSAIIPRGYYVTVTSDGYGRGETLTLTGDVPDITVYGRFWNDVISSIDYRY